MKTMMKIKADSHTVNKLARKLTSEGNPSKWMGAVEFEKVQMLKVTNEAAARKSIADLATKIEVIDSSKIDYETPEVNEAPEECTHRFIKKQKLAARTI